MLATKPMPITPGTLSGASLTLAAALMACALPASADPVPALYAITSAGTSQYNYNTFQGVVTSSGTSSGTTALNAPAAFSNSYSDEGGGSFHGIQTATASADYATAGLHAAVFTEGFSQGRAHAQLDDTITFNVAGASASTVTSIGLDLTLDGTISALEHAGYLYNLKMYASGRGGLSAGWTTQFYDSQTDPRNYVGWAVSGGAGEPGGFEHFEVLADSATHKHLHGTFTITGAQTAFDIFLGFNLSCSSGTDCDFGNSGHLRFDMPDNVSYTSASGLLLTGGPITSVPEPATLALLLASLGVLGLVSQRRRVAV